MFNINITSYQHSLPIDIVLTMRNVRNSHKAWKHFDFTFANDLEHIFGKYFLGRYIRSHSNKFLLFKQNRISLIQCENFIQTRTPKNPYWKIVVFVVASFHL